MGRYGGRKRQRIAETRVVPFLGFPRILDRHKKMDKTLVPVRSRRPRPDFQTFKMGTATERGASGVVTEHGGFIGV